MGQLSGPPRIPALALIAACLLAANCAAQTAATPQADIASAAHPEARLYEPSRDAGRDVAEALARAAERGTYVLIVMGADWCHDSRALAGWLSTPRFARMIHARYELVYVDVGRPQEEMGRNLQIAWQRGVEEVSSTPAVLILSPGNELLNADTATGWGNAASRGESEIFDYFAEFDRDSG
ncbi:MAG: thioredoxin family protein [Sphingomonadales bacterium]|nr:thioredoxin family protein [Sphingomonadales bacterium]